MATVFQECKSPALLINGTADHIHALFSLRRTIDVSTVVEEIKKNSSKWIKTKDAKLRSFPWQSGYVAFSIGQSNVPAVKRYIADQKIRHAKQTFKNEYLIENRNDYRTRIEND